MYRGILTYKNMLDVWLFFMGQYNSPIFKKFRHRNSFLKLLGSLYFIFFFQEISFLSFRVSYILLFFPRYSIHNFFSKTSLSRSSPSCFVLENHFLCFWAFYILPFFPRNSIHPIFSKKFYLQNFFPEPTIHIILGWL